MLIVDDSTPNRKMLSRILTNAGFTCAQAGEGEVGLGMVTADLHAFDLVLMDFEMPVMDGPTATKALRAAGFSKPILGVTGNALPADFAAFIAAGADDVLIKPVTLARLNEAFDALEKKADL